MNKLWEKLRKGRKKIGIRTERGYTKKIEEADYGCKVKDERKDEGMGK